MKKAAFRTMIGASALALPLALAAPAYAHGYTQSPPSRSYLCSQGAVDNCGAIQWEPQSVEGPKGFPEAGPADGHICSGGNTRFQQLDDPRGGDWPATDVTAGQGFDFTWTIKARHATASFRYFITNDSYDPSKPLTRAELESQPFLNIDYQGKRPPGTVVNHGTMPSGKSGKQMIVAVWDVADTGNAFYSCADVQFG